VSARDEIERPAILVVDDRPDNLKAFEGALARPDQDMVLAASGEEALACVLRRELAVIVLDVAMPGMTGFELVELLKERELTRRLPIIFVTASVYDMEHIYRAYEIGAVDCLRKPVDPHELRSKVAVFVELWRQKKLLERQAIRLGEAEIRHQRGLVQRAEARLRESEALYELTFDEAPVGIGHASAEGRWTRVNARLCEILDRPRGDLLGARVEEIARGAQARALAEGLDRVRADDTRVHASELELPRGQGPPGWITLTASALRDADGSPFRFIVVVDDLTERKRLEVERGRMVTDLREGIRARDDFLALAAHELKTPLTPLRLMAGSLLRQVEQGRGEPPLDALARRVVKLDEATARLEMLVDRLLDVSRLSVGRLVLNLEDVDLAAIARDTVARLAVDGDHGKPEITVDAPAPVLGRWDRLRVEEVVTNLVTNAMKYGAGRPIEVALTASDDAATLHVTDHGIGIPEDAQAQIFERFERVAPVRHYGGFGLGLWIARKLVEAHAGTITVQSRVGEGSAFTVELPRRPPSLLRPATAAPSPEHASTHA
jgi:PAS domain S-box-containing protein